MKFELSITNSIKANKSTRIRGFDTLPDACASAQAIAALRRDPDTFITIWWPGPHRQRDILVTVTTGPGLNRDILGEAIRALDKYKASRKAANTRWKFISSFGDPSTITAARETIWTDETIKAAFYRNDFEPVRKFLETAGFKPVAKSPMAIRVN